MARFLAARSIQPFMSKKLVSALSGPIKIGNGKTAPLGFEAIMLPELCNAVIDAADQGALSPQQQPMATQAKILLRAFSTVGITALVDEATGYQEVRDRIALQEILERYISDELLAWAKRFPDEFYEQLFRLRGWQYTHMSVKRPSIVGRLTNDIVYQRLAPGVLEVLRELVPRDEHGRLKHHFHRRLTEDVGHPALAKHLHAVIALMRASSNWDRFSRVLERAFPKLSSTIPLPLEFADEDDE